jgi:hypothetical protein
LCTSRAERMQRQLFFVKLHRYALCSSKEIISSFWQISPPIPNGKATHISLLSLCSSVLPKTGSLPTQATCCARCASIDLDLFLGLGVSMSGGLC